MSQGLIQGFMREAPLPDIIQLVSQGGKSGCFHISEDSRRAKIFLRDGRIVHAVSNDAEGLEAAYEVALWLDGRYHFEETASDVPQTITKNNAVVLMEMHRRMDEWRVISQKISSLDLYPNSTLLPGESAVGVSPREAKLLALLTGFYTISELAEVLQKPVLTIAKDIYGLIMANQVVLKGVRSGRRPEMPGAVPAPKPAPEAVEPAPMAPAATEPPVSESAAPETEPASTPEPEPAMPAAPEPPPPVAAPVVDPVRVAKLNAFGQRIAQTAKSVLPVAFHDMVTRYHTAATAQVNAGGGPDAVKNLALSISRGAVDAGLDSELVKALNAQLKALFNK